MKKSSKKVTDHETENKTAKKGALFRMNITNWERCHREGENAKKMGRSCEKKAIDGVAGC
jgi:hypothetical protein